MVYILIVVWALVWGFATKTVNENKGYEGGFWWGFWLGFVGLIIIACKPNNCSAQKDRVISDLMRNENMISNGGWKCCKCGKTNAHYVGTCSCGMEKFESQAKDNAVKLQAKKKVESEVEMLNLEKLRSYKDLLDSGVITQEEFDIKKSELLKNN